MKGENIVGEIESLLENSCLDRYDQLEILNLVEDLWELVE